MIEVDKIARLSHYLAELAKSKHGHHSAQTITEILRLLLEDRLEELQSAAAETKMSVCPWCGERDKIKRTDWEERTCGYCGHHWSSLKSWEALKAASALKGGHK